MAGRDWDASTYDRIADPMTRWGATVLERLELAGTETVLDAGCGSGRVTEMLLERLPGGHVIGLDASPAMIAEARERLGRFGERVELMVANLLDPLPIAGSVDAILSTATFHWVPDHDRLFENLAAVLRSDGRLVAQSGGAGNVAAVLAAADAVAGPFPPMWVFPTPEEERKRLEAAGFVDVQAWLQPEPTPIDRGEAMETYLRTIVLRPHLTTMRPERHDEFVREVARRIPGSVIDYVRLNLVAGRA